MDVDPTADPTFKLIEVTAKQIVDRISASANNSIDHDGSFNPDESGGGQLDNSDNASTRTLKSFTSDTSSIDNRRSSLRNEAGGGGGITPPRPITGENSLVQQLLTSVQNWIIDAHPHKLGKKRRNSLSLNKGITNDMHWVFSIESYMRTLDWSSQTVLGQRFSSQLVLWFKHLFHFKSYPEGENEYNSVYPHWDAASGVATIVQFVLHIKFPNFLNKGYSCFAEDRTYPVIYCSDEYLGHQIRFKLSLPSDSVKIIQTMNVDWVPVLEQEILNDCKRKFVPVMVLLNIGKNVQSLEAGCRLAEKYKLWIHLYGANTMSYFCKRPETDQIGHSFTIDLSKWLRSPAVPFLTMYKKQSNADQTRLDLCGLNGNDLLTFSPWFLTQAVGWTRFLGLVDDLVERGQFVLQMIQKFRCLTIVPNWSTLSDGQQIASVLTFRYKPVQEKRESDQNQGEPEHPSPQYVDTLNSWLYHIMERDLKEFLPVEFVYVEGYGWNVLIDLFKTRKLTQEEKEIVTSTFENHLTVLQATVSQKLVFSRLAKAAPELDWVDHEKLWAGLGAVRYIPKFARLPESSGVNSQAPTRRPSSAESEKMSAAQKAIQANSLEIKDNIDHLNAKIVDKLKAIDTAFSLGESTTGEWCVQFGMVTLETDVAELVRLVISAGEEIEASAEFLKRMSELVLEGIEKATQELKRESEEALWEEGILRRVPVVGTFVNWWSPPVKETGVRGRALNLVQGKVESTENIYKYHMQVEAFSSATTNSNTNVPNKPQ